MADPPPDLSSEAIEAVLATIAFDRDGLVPAVAQQHDSGEILMVAWMNRAALRATLAERVAVYWSRSRMRLWRKGETSGQTQRVVDLLVDCDADTDRDTDADRDAGADRDTAEHVDEECRQ